MVKGEGRGEREREFRAVLCVGEIEKERRPGGGAEKRREKVDGALPFKERTSRMHREIM